MVTPDKIKKYKIQKKYYDNKLLSAGYARKTSRPVK